MNKTQNKPGFEARSLSFGSDIIMTAWIILVGIAYFGPVFDPRLSRDAMVISPVYALMVLLSVLSLYIRCSRSYQQRQGSGKSHNKSVR
jgi:hypothetical protein